MIILSIFIIAAIGIGWYLTTTYDYDILGAVIMLVFIIYGLFHFTCLGLKEYNYEMFLEKRNAFQATLNESRENGRELEAAAIVKEVAEWNTSLAGRKYDNTTLIFDMYVDDRIMDLEPIK